MRASGWPFRTPVETSARSRTTRPATGETTRAVLSSSQARRPVARTVAAGTAAVRAVVLAGGRLGALGLGGIGGIGCLLAGGGEGVESRELGRVGGGGELDDDRRLGGRHRLQVLFGEDAARHLGEVH